MGIVSLQLRVVQASKVFVVKSLGKSVKVAAHPAGVQREGVVVERAVDPEVLERPVPALVQEQRPPALKELILLAVLVEVHGRVEADPFAADEQNLGALPC